MNATIQQQTRHQAKRPGILAEVSAIVGLASTPSALPGSDMAYGRVGVAEVHRAQVLAGGTVAPEDEASLRRALEEFASRSGATSEEVDGALRTIIAALATYAQEAN